jgi:hypothetical protein
MKPISTATLQEALAIIGLGLFAFGTWMIYPPASLVLTGIIFTLPLLLQIRGAK